jgi:hypothetical protein
MMQALSFRKENTIEREHCGVLSVRVFVALSQISGWIRFHAGKCDAIRTLQL